MSIRFILNFLVFYLFFQVCDAQTKTQLRTERIFLDNDTSRNCYTIIHPPQKKIIGYLFLLAGFGESAHRVMEQSTLTFQIAQSGILIIIPTLHEGVLSFGIDDSSQQAFKRIIADVRNRNQLEGLPFYMGGYSIGGSCVLKYSEDAQIKPNAIFTIDPPIDFEQMYISCKRLLRLSPNTQSNEETKFIINKLEEIMGGSPKEFLYNYYKTSPYSISDTTQSAIKKILNLPLRIYTEPDIHWWMKERGQDFSSMNATFHSAMISELNLLGNNKAALITTVNKGYRKPDNSRHPHSWSIVDVDDLIHWLLLHK